MKNRHHLLASLSALLLAATAPLSQADVILRIDITDPTNVTFSSTGGFAENNDSVSNIGDGITLIGFFSSQPGTPRVYLPLSSTLSSPAGGLYTTLYGTSFSNWHDGPFVDLNIAGDGDESQLFSVTSRALNGTATVDLSNWAAYLTLGKVGDIYASDGDFYSGPRIGQYEVVPEPTSLILLAGAGSFLYLIRRHAR